MEILILLGASILPVIVLVFYFESRDKGKKEPRYLKMKVFKWGILAAILAGIIEIYIDNYAVGFITNNLIYILFSSFLVSGFIEEGLKYLVVKKVIYSDSKFDEVMDGITYAILASLGFAMIENILYVVGGGFTIAISRALISVPAHAMFSGIMGYYIGKAKIEANSGNKYGHLLWKGFFIAVLYHGIFNFFLYTQSWMIFLVIPQVVIMGYQLNEKIKLAQYEDKVSAIKPQKKSLWQVTKLTMGTVLILVSTMNIAGNFYLLCKENSTYSVSGLALGFLFSILLLLISYALIKIPEKSCDPKIE